MTNKDRPVYMIGIAAKLVGMHPQTLRMYEREELVIPQRTAKETRLYSENDVELLKEIQEMTQKHGLNLAGVKLILKMKAKALDMQNQLKKYQDDMHDLQNKVQDEIQNVHKSYKHEISLYKESPLAMLNRLGINFNKGGNDSDV